MDRAKTNGQGRGGLFVQNFLSDVWRTARRLPACHLLGQRPVDFSAAAQNAVDLIFLFDRCERTSSSLLALNKVTPPSGGSEYSGILLGPELSPNGSRPPIRNRAR